MAAVVETLVQTPEIYEAFTRNLVIQQLEDPDTEQVGQLWPRGAGCG